MGTNVHNSFQSFRFPKIHLSVFNTSKLWCQPQILPGSFGQEFLQFLCSFKTDSWKQLSRWLLSIRGSLRLLSHLWLFPFERLFGFRTWNLCCACLFLSGNLFYCSVQRKMFLLNNYGPILSIHLSHKLKVSHLFLSTSCKNLASFCSKIHEGVAMLKSECFPCLKFLL